MSFFPQVFALLPAVAAIVVIVVALADRRDSASLKGLRDLDVALTGLAPADDELESSAA